MSKIVRKKHLKTIDLLMQATNKALCVSQENRLHDCFNLLIDCQACAIALGNHIEKNYGLNNKTVQILEKYCEEIYQFGVNLKEGMLIEESAESLKKTSRKIRISYEEEFLDKKEVVFLPYNASMWDSLESVWMAAQEDETCDAYVIPIPYYELDEEHNFVKLHDERNLYPNYVPITSYEDYDLEERHPDMIFIHNPYDEYNRITSIAPDFYSSRIKDFTDKLVYIPYFVWDKKVCAETVQRQSFLPGTKYADKVVLQSEKVRQMCISALLNGANKQQDNVQLEKKILGLGSPKYDKVLNTEKCDIDIPSQWLKLIEKEDGSHKKIVFYNTSISSFLKGGEEMLSKMQEVFQIFKNYKDEVTLLWRPHPLMEQTVKSMYPEIGEHYNLLVHQYKEEGWGIYDDTSDLNRAVVLSDAYFGDPSSVVHLYQETKKPILLQDISLQKINDDTEISILFEDAIKIGYKLIFIARDFNIIFNIDLKTQQLEVVGSIPEKSVLSVRMGAKIVCWKNKLVFAPMGARNIWIYDMNTKDWESIEIDADKIGNDDRVFLTFQAIVYKNSIIFIGAEYPAFICLNMNTKEVEYIESPYREMRLKKEESGEAFFRCDYVQINQILYLASCLDNLVLKFNMDTFHYEWIKVGRKGNRYSGITWDGRNFWLSPRKNTALVKWNGEKKIIEYPITNENTDSVGFTGCLYKDNKVIIPGLTRPYTVCIEDLNKGTMKVLDKQYVMYKWIDEDNLVNLTLDGEIRLEDRIGNISILKSKIRKKDLIENCKEISRADLNQHFKEASSETVLCDLSTMLQYIIDETEEKIEYQQESYGKRIWNILSKGD